MRLTIDAQATTMKRHFTSIVGCLCLFGCTSLVDPGPQSGTESHFLRTCKQSSECGSELRCVANRCTLTCEGDVDCSTLPGEVICLPNPDQSEGSSCDLARVTASGGTSSEGNAGAGGASSGSDKVADAAAGAVASEGSAGLERQTG